MAEARVVKLPFRQRRRVTTTRPTDVLPVSRLQDDGITPETVSITYADLTAQTDQRVTALIQSMSDGFISRDEAISAIAGALDNMHATTAAMEAEIAARAPIAMIGAVNGIAPLDTNGMIPLALLPGQQATIVEVDDFSDLPASGQSGVLYVLNDGRAFRWGGTQYWEISADPGSTDSVPEGSINLYFTADRARSAAPIQSVNGQTGPAVNITKADVGLANVANLAPADYPISSAAQAALDDKAAKAHTHSAGDIPGLADALQGKVDKTSLGIASGVATLDANGFVPSSQLPSFVDDVIDAASVSFLPGTGETSKIYVAKDTGKIYRWSGSQYVEISGSPGSTDAVPEGATNKYFTDARAKTAVASDIASAVSAEANNRNSALSSAVTARDQAIAAAIASEVTSRNTAISSAVSAEVSARNTAIAAAIVAEVTARDAAIAAAVAAVPRDTFLRQINVTDTAAIAITLGVVDKQYPCAGAVPGERYMAFIRSYKINSAASSTAGRPAGYYLVAVDCLVADTINITHMRPAILLGGKYELFTDIVKVNT